jgi:phospholipid/cholesterol/gamma-HCH transport system substrate-binding protein
MRRRLGFLIAPALVVVLLGGACTGGGNRELVAEFLNVGDLVGRASVQQSDSIVGSVRSIDLVQRDDEWVARVVMRIDPDTRISEGATAVVRSTSLLGEKFVDLVPAPEPGPQLPDGAVLPVARTSKAPELEELFSQLGAILATGALEDLARLTTAGAMILEGQEENLGRVLDQTAKLISSLHAQKDSIASAVDDLASAARTLSSRTDTLDRALSVSDDALGIVADQQSQLDALVVQLDRLGKPLGDLTRAHKDDIDAQVKALRKVVPQLYAVRDTLGDAVDKLPDFTRLFARAAPGDYVQLDILLQAVPVELSGSGSSLASIFMESTKAPAGGADK